jgi:hypothetical protein
MYKTTSALVIASALLAGCMPAELIGIAPDRSEIRIAFYPGGNVLDDLIIIDGVNHFGTAQYQMDDPVGDIGFRTTSSERVQAECVSVRQNFMGDDECARYEVYRSSFGPVPEGTTFNRPEMF